MKLLAKIFIGLVVVLGLLFFGRNFLIKNAAEQGVRLVTGLELSIDKFNVGFDKIDIKGMKLFNPPEFAQDPVMVDIPEIFVSFSPMELISGKIHLSEVRFHLKKFLVVEHADGSLNLDKFKALSEKSTSTDSTQSTKEDASVKKDMNLQIDKLVLIIDTVMLKRYDKNGKSSDKVYNINLNERHENITDPVALAQLIVFKAMFNTTIGNLTNFDVKGLRGVLTGTLGNVKDLGLNTLKGTGDAVTGVAGTATDTLKNVTGGVLKALPFGSK